MWETTLRAFLRFCQDARKLTSRNTGRFQAPRLFIVGNPSACRGLPALPARDVVLGRALHSVSAGSLWIAIGVSPLPSRLIATDYFPFP